MQKSSLLVLIGLLSSVLYLILPSWYKIICFIVPTITLAWVYQRTKNGLNYLIILLLSGLYLICASSLMSLDIILPDTIVNISDAFHNTVVVNSAPFSLGSVLDTVFGVAEGIVIIIPIAMAVYGVVMSVVGLGTNIDTVLKVLLVAIAVILVSFVYFTICTLLGIKIWGGEWFQTFITQVWNWIASLSTTTFGSALTSVGLNTDNAPQMTLDAVVSTPRLLSLTVTTIYPLLLSFLTFGFGLYYKIFKNHKVFGSIVSEPQPQPDIIDDSNRFTISDKKNLSFLAFIVLEFCFWIYFAISYTPESFLTYQNILFFSTYSIIILGISIFLFLGTGILAKNTLKGTLIGTLLGVLLLFLFQNMFVGQTTTLSAIKNEMGNPTLIQIANYFVFVSPTETLLFQIFLPALVLLYFFNKNKVLSEPELIEKIDQCNTQISIYTAFTTYDVVKSQKKLEQLANEKAKWQKLLGELNQERELGLTPAKTKMTSIQFLEYLLLIVVFNIGFGILHFFKSAFYPDISSFIASGLLAIYTCSGMIITLIGYKYGWISAIISHAIFDSITLVLVIVMSGGLI